MFQTPGKDLFELSSASALTPTFSRSYTGEGVKPAQYVVNPIQLVGSAVRTIPQTTRTADPTGSPLEREWSEQQCPEEQRKQDVRNVYGTCQK
jgi:hypothetical protein